MTQTKPEPRTQAHKVPIGQALPICRISHAIQAPADALEKPTPIDSYLDDVDIINGIMKK